MACCRGMFARGGRRQDVPWVSVLACGAGWAMALGFSFERLITIDLVLYGASLLLEFAALVILRRRAPEMPRPFRVPGGTWGGDGAGCSGRRR